MEWNNLPDLENMKAGEKIKTTIFDLTSGDISELVIIENYSKNNCYIKDKNSSRQYDTFILSKNRRTEVCCIVTFFRSSTTNKYLPRLTFKKTNPDGCDQASPENKPVNIHLGDGDVAIIFWRFISFLGSFKALVDVEEFERKFAVIRKDFYLEFDKNEKPEKIKVIKDLVTRTNFDANEIKSIISESRRNSIRFFLYLLKNKQVNGDIPMIDWYKNKHLLKGDEAVWHHFLENNDWILGLNVDVKFISDFISEVNAGTPNSTGKGSPEIDFIGISNYTTLVELKTSNAKIFKERKGNNSRANTWEFTAEFISGISQCLGQKFCFDKNIDSKTIVDANGTIVNHNTSRTIDPKTIFIIGNRHAEFPHDNTIDNIIKSETFELFRRNNRNIDIITYDELFERAYHIVFSEKIQKDWYETDAFDVKTTQRDKTDD